MQKGKSSIEFENPPIVASYASVAGKKEGEGPLGRLIDVVEQDEMFGTETWEQAESAMQKQAADLALEKGGIRRQEIRYLFAGDLLGQLIATSFGTVDMEIPLFGLYGACSTMAEALCLGAMTVHAGYGDRVLAIASSHFATAEKQFRFPLAYGNQRPFSATWTVTGAGAVVLSKEGKEGIARITGITPGKIVDFGSRDSMNMGAAMAPAAFHTIRQNFEDMGVDETHYDKIITGDLGEVGSRILLDMMKQAGVNLEQNHMDCGMEIYQKESQDTHAGGSGCGCAAVTLCSYILPRIRSGEWKRVLFLPTGALLSTVSFNEGQSIPGIAHGVVFETCQP
ncbi:MAG: stage V sporulation protein AD [Hungatella sp.]|nr:stage V sporulation protein AD [Hungatella sp.]